MPDARSWSGKPSLQPTASQGAYLDRIWQCTCPSVVVRFALVAHADHKYQLWSADVEADNVAG